MSFIKEVDARVGVPLENSHTVKEIELCVVFEFVAYDFAVGRLWVVLVEPLDDLLLRHFERVFHRTDLFLSLLKFWDLLDLWLDLWKSSDWLRVRWKSRRILFYPFQILSFFVLLIASYIALFLVNFLVKFDSFRRSFTAFLCDVHRFLLFAHFSNVSPFHS